MFEIYFLQGVVDKKDCEKLNLLFDASIKRKRGFKGEINENIREAEFVYVGQEYNTLVSCVLEENFSDILDTQINQQGVIYEYPQGIGFKTHYDEVDGLDEIYLAARNGQPIILGDYTAVIGLSKVNDYEGGELFFPKLEQEYKLLTGDVLLFPTNRNAIHGVRPIRSGSRRVYVNRVFKK